MKSSKELSHRLSQTTGVYDLHSTLRNVEINVIDSCNRDCDFCPHSDITYQYRHGRGNLALYTKLAEQLQNYTNSITLCGYGEPVMFKQLPEAISILRQTKAKIELTTNGELLSKDKVNELFDNGLDFINVSIYEHQYVKNVETLVDGLADNQYMVRNRYLNQIKIVDRKGIINSNGLSNTNPCYLPSYKMMVNYTGEVFLCCNDWSRKNVYGNIFETDIFQIWEDSMMDKRMELLSGIRNNECQYCNIGGTDYGKESAEFFSRKTNEST